MTCPILDTTIKPTSNNDTCRESDDINSGVNTNPLNCLAPPEEGSNSQTNRLVTISGYVWLCCSRDWKNTILYPAVNIRKIQ